MAYASWRPWRRQERARVGMAPERLFRPFQGRTVADADRAAEGASLPLPLGTRLCGCGAVMLHPCHRTGPLHRARTQAAGASSSAAAPPPPPPPQGPGGTAAELMVRRAAQEPEFALWLLQVATVHASAQGPPPAPATGPRPLAAAPALPPVAAAPDVPPGAAAPVLPPAAAAPNGLPDPPAASLQPQHPAPDLPPMEAAGVGPAGALAQAPPGPGLPAGPWEPAGREVGLIDGLSASEVDMLEAMLEN